MKKTTRQSRRANYVSRSYSDRKIIKVLHKMPFGVLLVIAVSLSSFLGYLLVRELGGSNAQVVGTLNWKTGISVCNPKLGTSGVEGGTLNGHTLTDLKAVTNPIRQGQCSASVTVHPGDIYGSSTGERTMMQFVPKYGSSREYEKNGDEHWYGGSIYMPSAYDQTAGSWNFLFEWHGPSGTQAPLRLSAHGNALSWEFIESYVQGTPGAEGLNCNSGYCTKRLPSMTLPLTKAGYSDTWVDLMWHVKWSGDHSIGFFEGWWKRPSVEGDTWQYLGKIQASLQPWPENYFLLGIYRGASSATHQLYYGDFFRGNTQSIINNEFGITASPTPAPAPAQSAFNGVKSIPGKIEVEDFDNGGEGVSYHDFETTNQGGEYRNTGVDLQKSEDGTYNIGWVKSGEWQEYTTNIAEGTYDISARIATPEPGGKLQVLIDGQLVGEVLVPDTGSWSSYHTVVIRGVNLRGGTNKILRLQVAGNIFNTNWVQFSTYVPESQAPPPSPAPPPPVIIPGASPTKPVPIPESIPINSDNTIVGDFNADGLNDLVKDKNNDGFIDPKTEVLVDGKRAGLTDKSKPPIQHSEASNTQLGIEKASQEPQNRSFLSGMKENKVIISLSLATVLGSFILIRLRSFVGNPFNR